MPSAAFYTLGCKVNQYDSEAMMDLFKKRGYKLVDFEDKADIYIINSCTVTNSAASKSRKYARRAKRRNPEATVVMVGCYSQVSPEEIEQITEIDMILGTDNKSKIVNLIEEKLKKEDKFLGDIKGYDELNEYENLKIDELRETTRAYVKIQEGCNQFCSYCIIPYARGSLRSRNMNSVLNEVNKLVSKGVKEIVLTGIHLGAYGVDWDNNQALNELIIKLINIQNLERIRLSSIEITEINDKLLYLIKDNEILCPHLHIPLQSGSNHILDKMKRPYTREEFKTKIKKIKDLIPDIAISTDVMVGFPGETEEDFKDTYNLIKDLEFSRLHVFSYSPREGTPAAEMNDQLAGNIKSSRSKKLRNFNKKLMKKYHNKFLGKIKNVIIEEKKEINNKTFITGFTDNYIRVIIKESDEIKRGELVKVKLKENYNYQNVLAVII